MLISTSFKRAIMKYKILVILVIPLVLVLALASYNPIGGTDIIRESKLTETTAFATQRRAARIETAGIETARGVTADGTGITLKDYGETIGTATSSGGTLTVNLDKGNFQKYTMRENITAIDFIGANTTLATSVVLVVTQNASRPKTMKMTSMKIRGVTKTGLWAGATPPTLSSGVGDIDVFTFILNGSSNIFAFVGGQNFG